MDRRDFITLLGSAAAAWPLAARAQQTAMRVIGWLSGRTPEIDTAVLAGFFEGLGAAGYAENKNVAIEYRFANFQNDRLRALAGELVLRQVAVIVAPGGPAQALAAKAATATIPIVFLTGGDPVKVGLVRSLNRPGGNVTGVSILLSTLGAKRLEALHRLVPSATVIGFLVDPLNPNATAETRDVQLAAATLGLKLLVAEASSESDIDGAFASFAQQRTEALIVAGEVLFATRRDQIVTLAARHAIPAIYPLRADAAAGGLMSYGTSTTDAVRQAGIYAGRILKGEKPADLPIIQSTKFELVINLKTVKALGLEVPANVLAIADEVIE
jgi:putative ABC transport system substrate-binding protein